LGDVTQVDLPKEGETFRQGDVFGTVESVKAVSDLFSPFSGKVVKVNTPLSEAPQNVNEEPFDEGWMVQIELSKPDEVKALMDAEAYQDFLKESAE
jgi:glycine cleavage system H protein